MSRFRALVAMLLAGLFLVGGAHAQNAFERLVSPGELSRAHKDLDGTCNACHDSFNKGGQRTKCLDCHKEINSDFSNKRGFHGRSPDVDGKECKSCHVEHEGRAAALVVLEQKAFNHSFTDMPLAGGHVGVACAECHQKGVKFARAPTDCVGCHRTDEPHKGRLGTACASCHSVADWRTVSFEHAQTSFALMGKHGAVACASCHVNEVWKGAPSNCFACHGKDDAHAGKLGRDCASCHDASSWQKVKFDHSRTGFALVGRHAAATCQSCHTNGVSAPLPTTCNGCHAKDDAHKGRNGVACADCHTPRDWTSVTFDHAKTKFPLLGKHQSAKCETCHTRPVKEWKPPLDCNGCHQKDDKHKGLLGPACKDCHSETGWAKIRFDHARDAHFALKGRHSSAACTACHSQPVHVKAPPSNCIGCHRDDDPHKRQLGDGCAKCHSETGWKETVRFDHGLTDFPLLGKHASLACAECHASPAFLDADVACVSCHRKDDIHKGRLGPACSTCHNPADWKRWAFDHDRQTTFQLTGAHRTTACETCHRNEVTTRIEQSSRCISCHASDDKHRGSFGSACERCHTTTTFDDVTLRR